MTHFENVRATAMLKETAITTVVPLKHKPFREASVGVPKTEALGAVFSLRTYILHEKSAHYTRTSSHFSSYLFPRLGNTESLK